MSFSRTTVTGSIAIGATVSLLAVTGLALAQEAPRSFVASRAKRAVSCRTGGRAIAQFEQGRTESSERRLRHIR
jgi:hypothetical protein